MASVHIPVPAPMEVKGDLLSNWTFFKDQWEDYEVATGLREKSKNVRVATLRSVMGRDCLRILKNLEITDDDRKDPAKCIKALESYFKPTQNEIYEQYMFYSCDQGPNENVDQWVNRLRQLSKSCNFEAMTDSLLRDRVVLGTKDKAARGRMFREKAVNLNEAVDMLRASEVAAQQIKEIDQGTSEEVVHFNKWEKANRSPAKSRQISCIFCLQCHEFGKNNCPAYGSECQTCHQRNHWSGSKKCKKNGQKKSSKSSKSAHYVQEESYSSDGSCMYVDHQVANVKSRGKQPRVELSFTEKGESCEKSLVCLIDTGTTCNIMSIEQLNQIVPNAKLRQSNSKLHFYDGSYMKPLGIYSVYAQYGSKKLKLRFEIVTTRVTRHPLLSTNTCEKLGLLTLHTSDVCQQKNNGKEESNFTSGDVTVDSILAEYEDVFKGLGCLPGELHLEIDNTIRPVQHTPRKIPIATKEELKKNP